MNLTPTFLGCGSGCNIDFGNNSAYIALPNDGLLLLECGETVFAKLSKLLVYQQAKFLTVFISHIHNDHIGSLTDLIGDAHKRGIVPNIIVGGARHCWQIRQYLKKGNVSKRWYRTLTMRQAIMRQTFRHDVTGDEHLSLLPMPAKHVSNLACYGLLVTYDPGDDSEQESIFWSGDSEDCLSAVALASDFDNCVSYQEASLYDGGGHTTLADIDFTLQAHTQDNVRKLWQIKKHLVLMHFPDNLTRKAAVKRGYQVASVDGLDFDKLPDCPLPYVKSCYIVIEGGDLTGKTTMARKLADWFEGYGRKVILVEEPGGTKRGDEIRAIAKDKNSQLSSAENLQLFAEARQALWSEVISPALHQGKIVIATRNYWSTLAYQGYGQGLPLDEIDSATEGAMPDGYLHPSLAVILDIDDKERTERKRRRVATGTDDMVGHDAFEDNDDIKFATRVRNGYRQIAKQYNIPLVDASGSVDEEFGRVLRVLHDEYIK